MMDIDNMEGLVTVPTLKEWNLREHIFEYFKDCEEKNSWDGRTSIRISMLTKSIVSLVDSKYKIGSKTKTLTALSYIGCFRMIDYVDKEQWNLFIDTNAHLDFDAISICDFIGTDKHNAYYNSKFALSSIGYKWVDNLNKVWPVPDKKQIIYHMYNDHRFGKFFDICTDRMGFSIKEAANMFILYAIKDSDIMPRTEQTIKHLERIDELLKYNTYQLNYGVKEFNNIYGNINI